MHHLREIRRIFSRRSAAADAERTVKFYLASRETFLTGMCNNVLAVINNFYENNNMKSFEENELSEIVIGKCIKIHKLLGPGLFESVYEEVLFYELIMEGLKCERQKIIPVYYENLKMDVGFIADLVIHDKLILELKSLENILPVHKKQLTTYLKLSGVKLGLLINFNAIFLNMV